VETEEKKGEKKREKKREKKQKERSGRSEVERKSSLTKIDVHGALSSATVPSSKIAHLSSLLSPYLFPLTPQDI
jgi:hypothetical protein